LEVSTNVYTSSANAKKRILNVKKTNPRVVSIRNDVGRLMIIHLEAASLKIAWQIY
jgi:hypothetical protein